MRRLSLPSERQWCSTQSTVVNTGSALLADFALFRRSDSHCGGGGGKDNAIGRVTILRYLSYCFYV
eukprot:scaffold54300_cov49-Attheya_sp.AAC.1